MDCARRYQKLLNKPQIQPTELLIMLMLYLQADFACQRVSIFLLDAHECFITAVAQGLKGMDIDVKAGEGLVGKAIANGSVLVSNRASYDDRSLCRLRDHYTGFQTYSVMVAAFPIENQRTEGAVQLLNKQVGDFNQADEEKIVKITRLFTCMSLRIPKPITNIWTPELEMLYREKMEGMLQ